jgi:hypothetical protein
MQICQETPNVAEIRQKWGILREDITVFYCCWQHKFVIKAFLCNTEFFYIVDGDM